MPQEITFQKGKQFSKCTFHDAVCSTTPQMYSWGQLRMDQEGEARYREKDLLNILCKDCSLKASVVCQAGFLPIVFHKVFLIH